jgi:preprotein translocase subunit YajC
MIQYLLPAEYTQDVEAEISHNVRVKIAKSAIVSVIDNNKPVTPEIIKK